MLPSYILVLFLVGLHNLFCAGQDISVAHLTLGRRGGALARHMPADLKRLEKLVHDVERRYALTIREVKGNKLVRRWRARTTGTTNDNQLLEEPGQDGRW